MSDVIITLPPRQNTDASIEGGGCVRSTTKNVEEEVYVIGCGYETAPCALNYYSSNRIVSNSLPKLKVTSSVLLKKAFDFSPIFCLSPEMSKLQSGFEVSTEINCSETRYSSDKIINPSKDDIGTASNPKVCGNSVYADVGCSDNDTGVGDTRSSEKVENSYSSEFGYWSFMKGHIDTFQSSAQSAAASEIPPLPTPINVTSGLLKRLQTCNHAQVSNRLHHSSEDRVLKCEDFLNMDVKPDRLKNPDKSGIPKSISALTNTTAATMSNRSNSSGSLDDDDTNTAVTTCSTERKYSFLSTSSSSSHVWGPSMTINASSQFFLTVDKSEVAQTFLSNKNQKQKKKGVSPAAKAGVNGSRLVTDRFKSSSNYENAARLLVSSEEQFEKIYGEAIMLAQLKEVTDVGKVVKFRIHYGTEFGENVSVVGSIDDLGNWNAGAALKLKWSEGDIWEGEIRIFKDVTFEYRYFCQSKLRHCKSCQTTTLRVRLEEGNTHQATVKLLTLKDICNDGIINYSILYDKKQKLVTINDSWNPEDKINCLRSNGQVDHGGCDCPMLWRQDIRTPIRCLISDSYDERRSNFSGHSKRWELNDNAPNCFDQLDCCNCSQSCGCFLGDSNECDGRRHLNTMSYTNQLSNNPLRKPRRRRKNQQRGQNNCRVTRQSCNNETLNCENSDAIRGGNQLLLISNSCKSRNSALGQDGVDYAKVSHGSCAKINPLKNRNNNLRNADDIIFIEA